MTRGAKRKTKQNHRRLETSRAFWQYALETIWAVLTGAVAGHWLSRANEWNGAPRQASRSEPGRGYRPDSRSYPTRLVRAGHRTWSAKDLKCWPAAITAWLQSLRRPAVPPALRPSRCPSRCLIGGQPEQPLG